MQEDQSLFCDACGTSLKQASVTSPEPDPQQVSVVSPETKPQQLSVPSPETKPQVSAPSQAPKQKASKLCPAGLICSILSLFGAVLMIISWNVIWYDYETKVDSFFGLMITGYVISLLGFITGLVISIIGTARAKKLNLKGRGLGVAGIILSACMGVAFIAVTVLLILAIALLAAFASSVQTWPEHLRSFDGPEEKYQDYEVILSNDGERALITTWYWSGDPDDTVITIPDFTPDDVQISSVGGGGRGSLPPDFRIEFEDEDSDYRQTDSFKRSRAAECSSSHIETDPSYYGISSDTEVHYETLVFTKELGEYVDNVDCDICDKYFIIVNDDGSITFYTYDYYYVCDPDNTVYYTVDGELFEREED